MLPWSGSLTFDNPVTPQPASCSRAATISPAFHVLPVRLSTRIAASIPRFKHADAGPSPASVVAPTSGRFAGCPPDTFSDRQAELRAVNALAAVDAAVSTEHVRDDACHGDRHDRTTAEQLDAEHRACNRSVGCTSEDSTEPGRGDQPTVEPER